MSRCHHKPYGCMAFLLDIFLLLITGGLWVIWIFIREVRYSHHCHN